MLMVVNKYFNMAEMGPIKSEIDKQTKGIIDIEIKIAGSLVLSPRGKYQMFISNIKPE